ncbi:MAG TPA: PqqD family protein [Caldilineae bacterium]|nr:PqqD family protein [Caldilineae bacterium]
MNINLNSLLKPVALTTAETVDNQTVIIHLGAGTYFSLNATGSYLWNRLDGTTSLEAIAAELAQTYGIDATTTNADVLNLAQELYAEGLLETA